MSKKLTDKEANQLQKEIDHILDSGANSIRLLDMIDRFLERRVECKHENNMPLINEWFEPKRKCLDCGEKF